MIIGCPGSGKSTFAKELAKKTNLPLYHLDLMKWKADGTSVEKSVFMQRLSDAIQNSEWIIDGNYNSTIELRLQHCDTVFFLDYSTEVCLEGLASRNGKERTDIPWVETEINPELIEFIKNYNAISKPMILNLFEKYSDKNIIIFKTRKESELFLENL